MGFKIKEEHKTRVVAFNNSGLPLGKRKDLDVLAEIALRSEDPTLINLFEDLPTLETFVKNKSKELVEKNEKIEPKK
jgi:hypothetical protein